MVYDYDEINVDDVKQYTHDNYWSVTQYQYLDAATSKYRAIYQCKAPY